MSHYSAATIQKTIFIQISPQRNLKKIKKNIKDYSVPFINWQEKEKLHVNIIQFIDII